MKRDLSLIRLMLLSIEELAGTKFDIGLADFADLCPDRGSLLFHALLLKDARFVVMRVIHTKPVDVGINRLTSAGCDYLDAVRPPAAWREVRKAVIKASGGITLSLAKALAEKFAREHLPF